jgi:hypothetical protein
VNLPASLWARIEPVTSGCWLWRGYLDRDGYATFSFAGRTRRVHRILYEEIVGPIPATLEPDHLCGNEGCVNPLCLELVTHAENVLRSQIKRTHCPQGHPFTAENTYVWRGGRRCRICNRENARRYRTQKRRAA